jgi:hypothetical protein
MMNVDNQETITINVSEYDELKRASKKLDALEAAGVDNWQGYSYAMEILEGEDDKEGA